MRVCLAIAAAGLAGVFAAGVAADAARAGSRLTAEAIRIKDRPEAVRVVVRLGGASVESAQVFFKSPLRRLVLGSARVALEQPGTAALVPGRTARGVSVELTPRARALVLRAASAAKRFKYLSYRVRSGPQRLVVDLWKSAPPRAGTAARFGRRACLSVDVDSSQPGRLVVSGTVRRLFEATFVVRIRRADGRVIKRRIVTMQPGPWTQSIGYRVGSAQAGTVEAVALSAKDGSLDCLAQRRVELQPR